jgi:hypothetical protein
MSLSDAPDIPGPGRAKSYAMDAGSATLALQVIHSKERRMRFTSAPKAPLAAACLVSCRVAPTLGLSRPGLMTSNHNLPNSRLTPQELSQPRIRPQPTRHRLQTAHRPQSIK